MAKRPTTTSVTSGYTSTTTINNNFTAVRDQFDNTLSLDGSTPNAMGADLDMNDNDILNAKSVDTGILRLNGQLVTPTSVVVSPTVVAKREFETVALLLADTATYTTFAQDDYVRVVEGNYVYKVAASGASDHHITTAGSVKLYVLASTDGTLNLMAFGAAGDDATDDRAKILEAIDAAVALGGARIVTQPGSVHRYSGRIMLKPGVFIDFGAHQQTAASPSGAVGSQLVATDTTGGIDMDGGTHIRATLRTSQTVNYTGPMLDLNDTKTTLNFGRNERHASFDVDIRGNRQAGSIGVRFYSDGTNSGVSWVEGRATCGEMDYPFKFETASTGYINENWLDLISYGAVDGLLGVDNGAEISGNRIKLTVQPDSLARAKRAVRWDGTNNMIELFVWDWSTANVDSSDGGTIVELTANSGGNILDGYVSRGSGVGSFLRNPVIDLCNRATARNIVRLSSGRHRGDFSPVSMAPANLFQRVFVGDQDDSFAFANQRFTLSVSGATPPDATSQGRLFDLSGATLTVNSCTDFTVTLDLGVAPGGMIGMGVVMTEADRPDRIRVQSSPDSVTWTTVMEAGWSNDAVPPHLFRDDGVGNLRYWRLIVENDVAATVKINRWWACDVGFTRLPGAFAPVYNPIFKGTINLSGSGAGLYIGGLLTVRDRRTGWTAPTGTATRTAFDTATVTTAQLAERVKALIDNLISHGLIGA